MRIYRYLVPIHSHELGRSLFDAILLLAMVTLVGAAAVPALRKDVQKSMCYGGAAIYGDDLKVDNRTPDRWNALNDDTCRAKVTGTSLTPVFNNTQNFGF